MNKAKSRTQRHIMAGGASFIGVKSPWVVANDNVLCGDKPHEREPGGISEGQPGVVQTTFLQQSVENHKEMIILAKDVFENVRALVLEELEEEQEECEIKWGVSKLALLAERGKKRPRRRRTDAANKIQAAWRGRRRVAARRAGALLVLMVPQRAGAEEALAVLGLSPSVNPTTPGGKKKIRHAYHRLALLWHPDTTRGDILHAKNMFIKAAYAYGILTN